MSTCIFSFWRRISPLSDTLSDLCMLSQRPMPGLSSHVTFSPETRLSQSRAGWHRQMGSRSQVIPFIEESFVGWLVFISK